MTSTSPATPAPSSALQQVQHVVVLMLENRSFDHMLGYLYADNGNVSLKGDPFEGLTGTESNKDPSGSPVTVTGATPTTPNLYYLPGADPGEGYLATNNQLFGSATPTAAADNSGFIIDYAYTLGWETRSPGWTVMPGTQPADIMTMYTPATLPVLSALARGFAVCDHWYASVPTETLPNRAFALAATSQGHMDDKTKTFTCPSIFGLLSTHQLTWSVFGYDVAPLTRHTFTDITTADEQHFGLFSDFQAAAASGALPAFSFLEPSWSSTGNSEHPNYDVASGEQLVLDVYRALRHGPAWDSTMLVVTYDEHGGCYDHVPPPTGAVAPDNSAGEYGFAFDRFGLRVPTVLVSPLIEAGTVFRVPPGSVPLDHTSLLKTLELRWGLPSLTARDRAAPDFSAVLTLGTPRTDDPLAGTSPPVNTQPNPSAAIPSHLQQVHAELVSRLPVSSDQRLDDLRTASDYQRYIVQREQAWHDAKCSGPQATRPQAQEPS
ncbi:MAG TPA: alkaline phosphatase family protein [Acidimicrobiales bacterium]|nr:alkaline phosphatase family protein [Acidimicrobiales bacterium]